MISLVNPSTLFLFTSAALIELAPRQPKSAGHGAR
jgi:hypothetical protein